MREMEKQIGQVLKPHQPAVLEEIGKVERGHGLAQSMLQVRDV